MKINQKSRWWPALVIAAIFVLLTFRYERFAAKRHFGDFHVYYVTGERLLRGEPIYSGETEDITPFKYSPLVASIFSLLSRVPEKTAAGLWHFLNLLFLLGSLSFGLRLIECTEARQNPFSNKQKWTLASLSILGVSPAVIHCLNSGQVGLLVLFLFVLGTYYSQKSGTEWAGAFFFAFSAMFKYVPLLIIPYFLFRKRSRFVLFFCFSFLFLHFLPAVWLGWRENLACLGNLLPHLTSTTMDHISFLDFKNQSVWAYFYRLFYYDLGIFEISDHPEWLTAGVLVLFVLLYSSIVFSKGSHSLRHFVIDCALLAILTILFNPNAWKHNFVLLVFPYLILVSQARKEKWRSWKSAAAALVFILFLGSNRSGLGWSARYELMSMSVLLCASLIVFISLVFSKREKV